MDIKIFEVFGKVAGIGGLSLAVLLYLFRQIIQKTTFSKVKSEHAFRIIQMLIICTSAVAILGIGAYSFSKLSKTNAAQPITNITTSGNCNSVIHDNKSPVQSEVCGPNDKPTQNPISKQ
jgi:hypothetical protein